MSRKHDIFQLLLSGVATSQWPIPLSVSLILRYANIPSSSSCLEFRSLAQRLLVMSNIVSFCRSVMCGKHRHTHTESSAFHLLKNSNENEFLDFYFINLIAGSLSQECFTWKQFRFVYISVKRHLNS